MIALLLAASMAFGQDMGILGSGCDPLAPVAGTAGFSNGLAAIRTNAQTYSAGNFARDRLRGTVFMAMDFRGVFGVARVPSLCTQSDSDRLGTVYNQPLDVGATNLGLALPILYDSGPLHISAYPFYASSVTTSTMGARLFTTTLPLINLYPATFAPLIGSGISGGSLSTFAVDWIGGGVFKSDVVSVQAGYTGSRGMYLDVTQEKVAIFFNTALKDGFQLDDATYVIAGLQRFDLLKLGVPEGNATMAGMTSVFYRRLPQAAEPEETGPLADARRKLNRLKTGHLRQEDIAELVDIRAAWQFGEQSQIRELTASIHTNNWHTSRLELDRDVTDGAFFFRAGMVNLPDQPLFGVEGGPRPHLRGVYKTASGDGWGLELVAQMNDPDLLDLYPFAYNAFGISMEMSLDGANF